MEPTETSGYKLCYLDGRRSVSVSTVERNPHLDSGTSLPPTTASEGWLAFGKAAFAICIVAVLITLGLANVVLYTRWHEVEDGVFWGARAEGVTAVEIAGGSAAAKAG